MYCGQCGETIDDSARFCQFCGIRQGTNESSAPLNTSDAVGIASSGEALLPRADADREDRRDKNRKALGVFLAMVVLLALIGSIGGGASNTDVRTSSSNEIADALEEVDNLSSVDESEGDPTRVENWSYSTDVDKVRGGSSKFATTTSTNTIHQDAPYAPDTTMSMTVRRMPSSGTDVVLTISSGQMMCPSYDGCSGTVRFDSGPSRTVRFNGPADNSSDTIFVVGADNFISRLKKAKKVIIEKTLYEAGNPQFEFNVADLKWET